MLVRLFLQIAIILLPWYLNIILALNYIPILSSMDALCAREKVDPGPYADFIRNYACAQLAQTNPTKILDRPAQVEMANNLMGVDPTSDAAVVHGKNWATYTPQSMVFIIPLTKLPLNQAIILFEIISITFFLLVSTTILRRKQHYSWAQIILWMLVALATPSFLQVFGLGQYSFLLAGLAGIFLLTWQNQKHVLLPAFCLALSIALKPHRALVLLMMTIATKRYRLLFATIFISFIFLAICAMVLGLDTLLNYPAQFINSQIAICTEKLTAPLEHTTAYTLGVSEFLSFITHKPVLRMIIPSTIADLLVLFIIWRKADKAGAQTYPFAYATSVIVDLLIGPYENLYDLFSLSMAWAITLPIVELSRISNLKTAAQQMWFVAFNFYPIISWAIVIFYLPVCGAMHMILLFLLLVIAWLNFNQKTFSVDSSSQSTNQ